MKKKQAIWTSHAVRIWVFTLLLILVTIPARDEGSSRAPINQPDLSSINQFWQKTLAEVAKEPLDAHVEKVKAYLPYFKYEVTYHSLGGVTIQCWLSKPIQQGASPKPLPAIVTVPGYGGWQQGITLSECQRGYIVLQVYPRGQGESEKFWKIDGPDKLTWRIAHPEGYYYQGAYVDVIRGIDYLLTRPDVDKSEIGIMGTSQGGGIALAVAALDPRVKVVVAHVPFLCNMRLAATVPSLVRKLLHGYGVLNANSLDTLDYFDPYTLAPRIKVPALLSAGGKDTTCPAATIRSVYGRLGGIKAIAYYPDLPHTSSIAFYQMSWKWMERYLPPGS